MPDKRHAPVFAWSSPRFFGFVLALVFMVELGAMFAMPVLLPADFSPLLAAIIDASLLTLVVAPILWWVVFGPLRTTARTEHAKYEAIVATAADGIIILDGQGRVESCNRAAELLFDRTAGQTAGQSVKTLMPAFALDMLNAAPKLQSQPGADGVLHAGERFLPVLSMQVHHEDIGRRADGSSFPIDLSLAEVRLDGRRIFAATVRDITERKRVDQQLRQYAFTDSLTGLGNRVWFMEALGSALARSKRRAHFLFGVLFLDLDGFKAINDSHGHLAGDQILIAVARRLRECSRPGDIVARFGGDEFAILLDDLGKPDDALRVAMNIQRVFEPPFELDTGSKERAGSKLQVMISVSIGIALGAARHESPEQILRDADIAMYFAKNSGKARSEVFDAHKHANLQSARDKPAQ